MDASFFPWQIWLVFHVWHLIFFLGFRLFALLAFFFWDCEFREELLHGDAVTGVEAVV